MGFDLCTRYQDRCEIRDLLPAVGCITRCIEAKLAKRILRFPKSSPSCRQNEVTGRVGGSPVRKSGGRLRGVQVTGGRTIVSLLSVDADRNLAVFKSILRRSQFALELGSCHAAVTFIGSQIQTTIEVF